MQKLLLSWCGLLACRHCVEEPGHGEACQGGRASSSHSSCLAWLVGLPFEFFSTWPDGFETKPGEVIKWKG